MWSRLFLPVLLSGARQRMPTAEKPEVLRRTARLERLVVAFLAVGLALGAQSASNQIIAYLRECLTAEPKPAELAFVVE